MPDVRLLRLLSLLFVFAVALVVAPRTSSATRIRIFEWAEIEDYAAGSTHVVVGRFVGWEREPASFDFERPISVRRMYGDVALARIHVQRVIAGSNDVLGLDILVIGEFAQRAGDGAVLFLRRDEGRFWMVRHALFSMKGSDVQLPTVPGRMTLPLGELAAKVRAVRPVRITWSAQVAERASVRGTLRVVFVARNEGDHAANALAPSRCRGVKAYPLDDEGLYDANRRWLQPAEWFDSLDEPSPLLAPGEQRSFEYDVPLASHGIGNGQWDIVLGMTESFCRLPQDAVPRALPNYMADRVVRVTVEPSSAPVPPVHLKSAPPAWADGRHGGGGGEGCSARTASPTRAVQRALAFVGLVVVAGVVLLLRRRARRSQRPYFSRS